MIYWKIIYDAHGIREGKTVQTGNTSIQHDYVTLAGKVIRETYGTVTVDYLYDNGGNPYKIIVNDNGTTTSGYYVLNLQGDVIAILDSTGAVAVKYEYDAWGKEINAVKSGGSANTLYGKNALKYRGYYYDADLGMYYLKSRFYDAEICRFINADGQLNMSANLLGVNQYTYCVNNPVVYVDESGTRPVAGISLEDETATERKASFEDVKIKFAKPESLPTEGDANSSQTLNNPDGTPKQKRWYGPDGLAVRDRDYNHTGNLPFPHDHEWNNGKRGEEHLPPSPDYTFSSSPILGTVLVGSCFIGIVIVIIDDLSIVGIANDGLLVPLGIGVITGIDMIF